MMSSYCDMMTNQWFKEIWIEALRSGEYEQGRGALRNADTYCCLGVAVEEYRKLYPDRLTVVEGDKCKCGRCALEAVYEYDGQSFSLPDAVISYMGVSSSNPLINGINLADWNDTKLKTFAEIADMIEEYL